ALALLDHRTDVGVRIGRIAHLEGFHGRHELGDEVVPGVLLDEDPLYRDAALPGEGECVRGELGCAAGRRVMADDRGCRIAELELDALARGTFGDPPADGARAREGD